MLVKKYGNRRLYDTEESCYITLEGLTERIRAGSDAQVVDAKTGKDLTQATLTQIIVEGRRADQLLPIPLLTQLIRLGDDALAEFLGRYVSSALEVYLQARQGAQSIAPYNPFAMMPFNLAQSMARYFGGPSPWGEMPSAPPPSQEGARRSEVDDLRRELEELKRSLHPRRK